MEISPIKTVSLMDNLNNMINKPSAAEANNKNQTILRIPRKGFLDSCNNF